MSDDPGAPETAELAYAVDDRSVALVLEEDLYPLDAVYGAAFLFIDRCWLMLDRPSDRRVRVRLRSKDSAPTPEVLDALAGEFANALLTQTLRLRLGESTRALREYTVARAFFGGESRANIDALLAELDAEELADDPLEISVPWETGA